MTVEMGAFLQSQGLVVNSILGLVALVFLILAANEAVKRLVRVAEYFQLSATFMGMTVISLATSIPEISSHLTASAGILGGTLDYKIASAVVLGSNIGSDVVQQTLILGIVVWAAGTLYFRRYLLWKSLLPMIGAALLCMLLARDGTYSRTDGAILFAVFVAYTYYLYWDERKFYKAPDVAVEKGERITGRQALGDAGIALLTMLVTVISAQVVLSITELTVETTGLGGSLIGVVTLGVASALPELTTALAGIGHKEHGITLGTLIGSNITNPLVAIGLGSLVSTYWVPRPHVVWDLPWQAAGGAILWAILWFGKGKLSRLSAIYLMVMYALYIGLRAIFFAVD
ncbi:MAG: sodium:calcium antiporter [Anaerolineae bacterium]